MAERDVLILGGGHNGLVTRLGFAKTTAARYFLCWDRANHPGPDGPLAPCTGLRLQPLAVAPTDTSRVAMLVATTRKPSEDPGKLYSGDRGTAISLNSVDVSIPPDRNRKIGEVQWPSRMPPNPEQEFAVTKVAKVQSDGQALDWYPQESKFQASGHHFRTPI